MWCGFCVHGSFQHAEVYKLSCLKCSLNVDGQINVVLGKLIAFPLKNKALKYLGTNVVGTKVYSAAFSGILSSGGLLHSDWLPPNRVIAHYHRVDVILNFENTLSLCGETAFRSIN